MRPNIHSPDYLEQLTGINQRQLDVVLGTSVAQRDIEKAVRFAKEVEKWNNPFSSQKYARDFAVDFKEHAQRSVEELIGLSYTASAQRKMMESLGLAEGSATGSAALLALREYTQVIDISSQMKKLVHGFSHGHLVELMSSVSASKVAADTFSSRTQRMEYEQAAASASWAQQLSRSMAEDDLYRRFAQTLDIRKSLPTELWPSATEAAKRSYEHLFAANEVWREQLERLTKPDYLTSLLSVIQHDVEDPTGTSDFLPDDSTEGANDDELLRELSTADSPEHFAEIFSRCSRWLKWAIFTFVVAVVWPVMIGVAGNLVTPYVEQYLDGRPAEQKCVQVREIKKLSMGELGVELKDYRFSTAKILTLRETPNARARKTGELLFGQVVAVVSVKRDWTEVIYQYGDGETISGWVFTRYLEKFRR